MPFLTPLARLDMHYPAGCLPSHPQPILRWAFVLLGLTISLASANRALATGGPENVLLVINPLSSDSLCIGNYYAELRHIPPNNFFFLDWDPKEENTDVDTFREKILKPVLLAAMRPNHGQPIPGRQIDYIIYSSDFPWGIRIDDDLKRFLAATEKQKQAKQDAAKPDTAKPEQEKKEAKPPAKPPSWTTYITPVASINGLTFLWEPVLGGAFYVHPQCNWYARTGAGTGQGTDVGLFQHCGVWAARRGGKRSGTALHVVDDAGRNGRPRQFAQ